MRSNRRVHFTGTDNGPRQASALFWTPVRVAKVSLIGVALALLFAVYAKYNSMQHALSNLNYSDQVDFVRRQGSTGIKDMVDFLLYPDDEETALMYLKLIDGELFSPEMEVALLDALDKEKGDKYLVSLSLCMAGNVSGLPRFVEIIKNSVPGETKRCCASFFKPPDDKSRPVQKHYGRDDDITWAFAVIEDTLHHTFEGQTIAEKRETLLNWWETNKGGTMIDWQCSFLSSQAAYNRTNAFDQIMRRIWKQPALISHLVEAMKNEEVEALRFAMSSKLFRIGVPESLPVFDEYLRSANTELDISTILATVVHVLDLPSEFSSVDAWIDGRDDAKSFAWLRSWWVKNYDLLVFSDEMWRTIGVAADNPENNLFD